MTTTTTTTTTTSNQNINLGEFNISVEALEGWARVCPTDKYEIEFRLNRQRHVTSVTIAREVCNNVWRNQHFTLAAQQCSPLNNASTIVVRVRELKSSWTRRHVTLGVAHVHTRDLMGRGTRPQLISLLANASGSLKLKLCVWWTPPTLTTTTTSGRASDSWSPISRLSIHDNIMKSLTSLMFSCDDSNSDSNSSVLIGAHEKRTVF